MSERDLSLVKPADMPRFIQTSEWVFTLVAAYTDYLLGESDRLNTSSRLQVEGLLGKGVIPLLEQEQQELSELETGAEAQKFPTELSPEVIEQLSEQFGLSDEKKAFLWKMYNDLKAFEEIVSKIKGEKQERGPERRF
jgi:hypothetical protein